jgi:hypothetical protein
MPRAVRRTLTPHGARVRAAIELASHVEGLRLVLATTVGDPWFTSMKTRCESFAGLGSSANASTSATSSNEPLPVLSVQSIP